MSNWHIGACRSGHDAKLSERSVASSSNLESLDYMSRSSSAEGPLSASSSAVATPTKELLSLQGTRPQTPDHFETSWSHFREAYKPETNYTDFGDSYDIDSPSAEGQRSVNDDVVKSKRSECYSLSAELGDVNVPRRLGLPTLASDAEALKEQLGNAQPGCERDVCADE